MSKVVQTLFQTAQLVSLSLVCLILIGCHQSKSVKSQAQDLEPLFESKNTQQDVVVLSPLYLKTGRAEGSEILPLHIEFAVKKAAKNYVQDQVDEIKRILIVYFSSKDPQKIKSSADFTFDAQLTGTINNLLKSGHIEASRYKLVREET